MSRAKNRCPICDKIALAAHDPFCSQACADEDLGRWLGGKYRIPGEPASPEQIAAELENAELEKEEERDDNGHSGQDLN